MSSDVIHTKIIKIGNAQGVRLPKAILEMSHIKQDAEVSIEHGAIVIRAPKTVRAGWKEAFAVMHAKGDDGLCDEELPTEWDVKDWQWP